MNKQYSYSEFTNIDDLRSKIFEEKMKEVKPDKNYSLIDINKYRVKESDQTIILGISIRNGL